MADVKAGRPTEPAVLRDVVYIVFKRKVPLLALAVLGIVIIGYGFLTATPEYEASARVFVKRRAQGYQMPAEPSEVLRSGEVVQTELRIMTSAAVCAAVADSLNLGTDERGRALASARLEKALKTKTVPDADIIDLSYRDTDPVRAAAVVNTALRAYLRIRKKVELKTEALHYLERQAAHARAARDSVAARIAAYDGTTGALSVGLLSEQHMGRENRVLNDILTSEQAVRSREDKLALIEEWLSSDPDMSHIPSGDIYELGTVRDTHLRLLGLKGELVDARARYTDAHPEVVRLEREIADVERILRDEVEQAYERQKMRLEEWRTESKASKELLGELRQEDNSIAKGELDIRMLEHDLSVWADLYGVVADRLEEFRITAATDPSLMNVSIVSAATVPARPTPRPVNMKVVVGVFTIVFGVLLVFALENADQSFGRREDVQKILGVKVLASIPDRGYREGR